MCAREHVCDGRLADRGRKNQIYSSIQPNMVSGEPASGESGDNKPGPSEEAHEILKIPGCVLYAMEGNRSIQGGECQMIKFRVWEDDPLPIWRMEGGAGGEQEWMETSYKMNF